ncbi:NAD-dependent epimerase/dehydratase family protein [Castellaniella sp.]|uniref:NAD-dependent epimerase/dehydratase family protein n=1 Tax=Castellaniella sp. TaxID=1955812 RepID=UPI003A8DD951
MSQVLILGANGYLARKVLSDSGVFGCQIVTYSRHVDGDLGLFLTQFQNNVEISCVYNFLHDDDINRNANLISTILKFCKMKSARVVHLSSVCVYNPFVTGFVDEFDNVGTAYDSYSKNKIHVERMIRQSGIEYVILRLGHVIDHDSAFAKKIRSVNEISIRIGGLGFSNTVNSDELISCIGLIQRSPGGRSLVWNLINQDNKNWSKVLAELNPRIHIMNSSDYFLKKLIWKIKAKQMVKRFISFIPLKNRMASDGCDRYFLRDSDLLSINAMYRVDDNVYRKAFNVVSV